MEVRYSWMPVHVRMGEYPAAFRRPGEEGAMTVTVFWICALAFLSAYSYFIYPLVLLVARKSPLAARAHGRGDGHVPNREEIPFEPKISLLITAHNEEDRIRPKLEN